MNNYILSFLLLCTVFTSTLLPNNHPDPKSAKTGKTKIVFKSTDGGQSWQDISKGLPDDLQVDSISGKNFFVNDKGLFLQVGNGLYRNASKTSTPSWTKEISPDEPGGLTPVNPTLVARHYWGVNVKKTNGMSIWSPIFELVQDPRIRSTFETADGSLFIGTETGIFKTADNGKSWKQVHKGGLVGHLAESDGVLLAISMRRIIRSTDNGESWEEVFGGDRLAFDVNKINGGFAAITARSESGTRGLTISSDGGKTWQSLDAGPQNKVVYDSIKKTWNNRPQLSASMSPIIQVGENFFCTHPDGLFRSTDKGKTWKLFLPSVEGKVFILFISGNVIYAIPSRGGC